MWLSQMNQEQERTPLRISLEQLKPQKGDVSANLKRVQTRVISQAGGADVLVFPEAVLSGYFLEGAVSEAALSADQLAHAIRVPSSDAPDIVIGFYERWNRRLYNSVAYLSNEGRAYQLKHVHRKMFLPTYGVFDEARFVEPGTEVQAFDTRYGRFGMLVCEDAWHSAPGMVLALDGAEVVFVVSASPARDFIPSTDGRPSNLAHWDRIGPQMAVEHGVFCIVSQLVGSEGGKIFPGGSVAFAPDGTEITRAPLLQEGGTAVELDPRAIDRSRTASPLLSDLEQALPHLQRALYRVSGGSAPVEPYESARLSGGVQESPSDDGIGARSDGASTRKRDEILNIDVELVERTLVEFIREEVCRRRGFERVVLGVSGGVDSAVSLVLASRALGPENVYGFRLPYRTSSQESLDHAGLVLDVTGAHERTIEISDPIDSYVERYEKNISPMRKGNLMARLRAVILFDQSASLGALPLGTGNKSERLLGYFTWHADDSPPINPLGDLFKTQVWALARHLDVPSEIIEKPATADLVRGVNDEDELGISYHDADPILYWLTLGYQANELHQMGFEKTAIETVQRRLDSTHWKRELPTVAVLSSSAIGEFYLRPVDY
ncbi:MAG: NAD+ synthase [Gemmatimonadota bacterium]|nr:NAD+ synthase [Gemmatimonadota bacterium]